MRRKTFTLLALCLYYGIGRHLPASTGWGFRGFRKASKFIRGYLCQYIFKKCGNNINIEHGAYFGKGDGIEIGDNSGIGINAHIYPNTIIGDNVMMGPNVYMLDSTHIFSRTDITMIEQGKKRQRPQVIIGNDVWIGQDVMIMSSRTIKTGSIIAARCVLTHDYPEYSIVGGNPSKLIRNRKTTEST